MKSYPALLRKETDSHFGLDFPDFPGVVTTGRTLDLVKAMAVEALDLHVKGLLEDGAVMPEPSSVEDVMANPGNADAIVVLIDLQEKIARSACINVLLPQDLVDTIDHLTANRNKFIADAAREKLKSELCLDELLKR